MTFPRYPAYKPSGVEWLGEVPEHWNLCRTDAVIGSCRSTINADALAQRPVFHYSIPAVQETGDGQLEDGSDIDSGKLVVTEPQVLVSKLNPRKGTVCIAHSHDVLTVCSSEFVPLLPRSEDIRFLWYIVQSENYRTRLESLVESATKSHQRAAPSDIYRLMWSFPPRMEQTTIATFLDRETAKIDALIAEQQRLIELLKEKRQAVISHAVTKGPNPDAPMKNSGVEWLGEVPEHWTVMPLRLAARIESGHTPSRSREDYWVAEECIYPWFTLGDVWQIRDGRTEYVFETQEKVSQIGLENSAARLLPANTVVLSRTASVGFSGILGAAMATTQDFVNWICGPRISPGHLEKSCHGLA
jgi:type I restriction enzyme S subunit